MMYNLGKHTNKNKIIHIKNTNNHIFCLYIILLTLNIFFNVNRLRADGLEANGKTNSLPPQPTFIVGNIDTLIPLAETNYLDGKPILFFSETDYAKNSFSLLGLSNSVVFHQKGTMELLLELFPETGTVTTNITQAQNSKFRYTINANPLVLDIAQDDRYEIFAKLRKEVSKNSIIVKLDGKRLLPFFDISINQESGTHWQGFTKTYLSKGRHIFTVDQIVSDLIIVPSEVFQKYISYIKNLLQDKQVSYLFTRDEKIEVNVNKEARYETIHNFRVLNLGKYILRAYVSPINEEITFRNIGLNLSNMDIISNNNIIKNLPNNKIAIQSSPKYKLNIEDYPYLKVLYNLSNLDRNMFEFVLELDTDNDDKVDTLCYYENKPEDKPYIDQINFKIDFSNINLKEKDFWYKVYRELGWGKNEDLQQWYYDALGSGFHYGKEGTSLGVNSDLTKANHFVITKHFQPIDLKKNQMISLEYKLENPYTQILKLNFRIDTTGDGKPDKTIETNYNKSASLIKEGYVRQCINVLAHSGVNPKDEKSVCNLIEIIVLCGGEGKFYLSEFCNGSQSINYHDNLMDLLYNKKEEKPEERIKERIKERLNNEVESFYDKLIDMLYNKKMDIVSLDGKTNRENGKIVLNINNIPQQIQQKTKNIQGCSLKGLVYILNNDKGLPISPTDNPLKSIIKELQFYTYEIKKIPKYIAKTKQIKEWEKQFEEDVLRYGLVEVLKKNYLGKKRYNGEVYETDDWFHKNDMEDFDTFPFDSKDWKINDFQTATPLYDIYKKLISEPILELNGNLYHLKDGLKIRTNTQFETTVTGNDALISSITDLFRFPFQLDKVNVTEEECSITFSLSEYLKVDMVELMKPGEDLQDRNTKEPKISFKKINPTRYIVDVKTESPFWLVFSESFHAGWKAYVRQDTEVRSQGQDVNGKTEHWSALISAWRDKGKRIELTEHQMVNGYANGWYVPVGQEVEVRGKRLEEEGKITGDFQIVLEYKSQRLFEVGVLISGITFVSCIGYLCWGGIRGLISKKNQKNSMDLPLKYTK